MKKSQLRKIIRESIKGLMTEQYGGYGSTPCGTAWTCQYNVTPGPGGYSTGTITGTNPDHPNVRAVQFMSCNELNTTPYTNPAGNNYYGNIGYSGVGVINGMTQCMMIDGQVPQVGQHFQTLGNTMGGSSANLPAGGDTYKVLQVMGEQCTMNSYDGTEGSGGTSGPKDYPEYTAGGSSLPNSSGCPGMGVVPVSGCMDPNSTGCDPLVTQDDGSCSTAFVNDISGFLNSFGCQDPNANNYVPYSGGGSIAGWASSQGGIGCNVYPMITTPCGTQVVDLVDMFTQIQANGAWDIDNSCCTYPPPLVAGCTVSGSSNYDMYADGCEVNGVVDINDVTCCVAVQPGGGVTPTNVGPQNADYLNLQIADPITPTPNPNDPQVKRMKDLAFRGKK